ncbi:MAG: hypothetical protein DHS20C02_09500 [Micavibrio sp.]|nr:MAG: hypothetical protein DHS20C02_09500 [Micavibrio sp.]
MFKHLILLAGSIFIMTAATADEAKASDPENTITMEVSSGGTVTIGLRPDLAPGHVERVKKLTREGFYDGVIFHRVIDGFMAQTGDPTGTGTGGSNEPDLKAEFSDENYQRGTIGMARSASPDSANSQFFICFTDTGCSFLKSQYTVLGTVTDGMEYIDTIAKGEPPANPDKIVKMQVAADANPPAKAASAPAEPAPADAAAASTEPAASGEEAPAAPTEEAPAAAEQPATDH